MVELSHKKKKKENHQRYKKLRECRVIHVLAPVFFAKLFVFKVTTGATYQFLRIKVIDAIFITGFLPTKVWFLQHNLKTTPQ